MEFQGNPWNSKEFQGIPRKSKEFQGNPGPGPVDVAQPFKGHQLFTIHSEYLDISISVSRQAGPKHFETGLFPSKSDFPDTGPLGIACVEILRCLVSSKQNLVGQMPKISHF